jgi:hypothetical protein
MAGDTGAFGPGLVAITADGRNVVVELKRPGTARFYNVHRDGRVDLLSTTALPRGRTQVSLPLWAGERLSGRRTRQQELVNAMAAHPSQRLREALLLVVWERGTDPDRGEPRMLVDPSDPSEVPTVLFGDRPVLWASYLIR